MKMNFDAYSLSLAQQNAQVIDVTLKQTYEQLRTLQQELRTTEAWKGEALESFLHYCDLLEQYHASLIGFDANKSTLIHASEQLAELRLALDQLERTCPPYKGLVEE